MAYVTHRLRDVTTRTHEGPETDTTMAHAARLLAVGADGETVRRVVRAEAGDDGLAFLVFTAARLLAAALNEEEAHGL